jgi:hypothetical protein
MRLLCNYDYVRESVSQPLRPRVLMCYRPVAHIETLNLGRIETRICNEPLPPMRWTRQLPARTSLPLSLPPFLAFSLSAFSISVWLSLALCLSIFPCLSAFSFFIFPSPAPRFPPQGLLAGRLKANNGHLGVGCPMLPRVQKETRPVVDLTKGQSRGRSNEDEFLVEGERFTELLVMFKTSGIKSSSRSPNSGVYRCCDWLMVEGLKHLTSKFCEFCDRQCAGWNTPVVLPGRGRSFSFLFPSPLLEAPVNKSQASPITSHQYKERRGC